MKNQLIDLLRLITIIYLKSQVAQKLLEMINWIPRKVSISIVWDYMRCPQQRRDNIRTRKFSIFENLSPMPYKKKKLWSIILWAYINSNKLVACCSNSFKFYGKILFLIVIFGYCMRVTLYTNMHTSSNLFIITILFILNQSL